MKSYIQLALISVIAITGTITNAAVPVVTNVVAQQQIVTNTIPGTNTVIVTTNKLIDIYYDLFDDDGDLLKVRIEVSSDGGNTYSVPAFSFTGDIGDNVVTGEHKHVVWDAGKDWDGEYSEKMKVKVFATDAKGYPGLEWSVEIPNSGFLMGQDGGEEKSGPSKHVNIPWSYWLSKYEIRNDQYLDFLNSALVAGYIYRDGVDAVYAHGNKFSGVPEGAPLIAIGDDYAIRWNVNNFETVNNPTNFPPNRTNFPVIVTWYGAMAFARYYGYDLPTEAEWEKAARGPYADDEDQHLLFPWGDLIGKGDANFLNSDDPYDNTTTPVGYYNGNQIPVGDDKKSIYGMYDLAGNVSEWTRSQYIASVEDYPEEESLENDNNDISVIANRVYRGGSFADSWENLKCYVRNGKAGSSYGTSGFRVIRRGTANDNPSDPGGGIDPKAEIGENFDGAEWNEDLDGNWTVIAASGTWEGNSEYTYIHRDSTSAKSAPGYIQLSQAAYAVNGYLTLPSTTNLTTGVEIWARRNNTNNTGVLNMQVYDGIAWHNSGNQTIDSDDYTKVHFDVTADYSNTVEQIRLSGNHGILIDDVSIFSIPRN